MDILIGMLFVIVCCLLVLVVLVQKGRGGGLGAMFGGAGSSAFGTRTGDVFTWVTIVLTALFLILAVVATLAFTPERVTLAEPTFSPEPGPIAQPVDVSIYAPTEQATVYYTLDGSEPTPDAMQYERMAVKVQPGQTLRARAYQPGANPSEVAVAAYPEQGEQPATQPTEAVEAATQAATEAVNDVVEDPATVPAGE